MNYAFDYDGTYTRCPGSGNAVIRVLRHMGHKVYIVTMRDSEGEAVEVKEKLEGKVDGMFFTNRKAKRSYMFEKGINIDIWIDDCPFFVDHDAKG